MGKTALITGASSGIGYECAQQLAERGYDLILVGRNKKRLTQAAASLKTKYGIKTEILTANLSRPDAAEKIFSVSTKKRKQIDVLINNAGSGLFGEAVDLDHHDVAQMLTLNITSLTTLCTLFGKKMAQQGGGHILNVGSLAGNQPTPFFSSYAASKSYVWHYSLALRAELKQQKVCVTCLQPGYVRTAFDSNAGIESTRYKKFSEANGMDASKVAAIGIKALFANDPYVIAGWKNNVAASLSYMMPKPFTAWFLFKSMKNLTRD